MVSVTTEQADPLTAQMSCISAECVEFVENHSEQRSGSSFRFSREPSPLRLEALESELPPAGADCAEHEQRDGGADEPRAPRMSVTANLERRVRARACDGYQGGPRELCRYRPPVTERASHASQDVRRAKTIRDAQANAAHADIFLDRPDTPVSLSGPLLRHHGMRYLAISCCVRFCVAGKGLLSLGLSPQSAMPCIYRAKRPKPVVSKTARARSPAALTRPVAAPRSACSPSVQAAPQPRNRRGRL
jgi:hypothetical protein